MLYANLAKSDNIRKILMRKRAKPKDEALSTSSWAIDQLMDCFVKGAGGRYNKKADFDYLSYFFADMAKVRHPPSWFPRRSREIMLNAPHVQYWS